jgi:8-oxo-dGTP pyrophosphatase MutT (NUDIX family)
MVNAGAEITGPFLGVSAIVARDGAVLLGRGRGAHGAGTFAFPGGKPDPGEHPSNTVRRELLEETGLAACSIRAVAWTSDVFADGNLWRSDRDPDEVIMVSRWRDRGFFREYMRSAAHRTSHERIAPDLQAAITLERLDHLHTYEVVAR